jgi:hypothetical protein
VARSAELYYIVVCSTPSQSVAQANAKFLAEHDVSVSIERVNVRNELWYWVVSVQGFASNTAAKPYRDNIVKIGDLLRRDAWKDAYARNGLSSPGTATTPPR